jgi:hypothetical protein
LASSEENAEKSLAIYAKSSKSHNPSIRQNAGCNPGVNPGRISVSGTIDRMDRFALRQDDAAG